MIVGAGFIATAVFYPGWFSASFLIQAIKRDFCKGLVTIVLPTILNRLRISPIISLSFAS